MPQHLLLPLYVAMPSPHAQSLLLERCLLPLQALTAAAATIASQATAALLASRVRQVALRRHLASVVRACESGLSPHCKPPLHRLLAMKQRLPRLWRRWMGRHRRCHPSLRQQARSLGGEVSQSQAVAKAAMTMVVESQQGVCSLAGPSLGGRGMMRTPPLRWARYKPANTRSCTDSERMTSSVPCLQSSELTWCVVAVVEVGQGVVQGGHRLQQV